MADDILALLQDNQQQQANELLSQIIDDDKQPDWYKLLAAKLQQIVAGDSDTALADDDKLDYDNAAEIYYLIERLPS